MLSLDEFGRPAGTQQGPITVLEPFKQLLNRSNVASSTPKWSQNLLSVAFINLGISTSAPAVWCSVTQSVQSSQASFPPAERLMRRCHRVSFFNPAIWLWQQLFFIACCTKQSALTSSWMYLLQQKDVWLNLLNILFEAVAVTTSPPPDVISYEYYTWLWFKLLLQLNVSIDCTIPLKWSCDNGLFCLAQALSISCCAFISLSNPSYFPPVLRLSVFPFPHNCIILLFTDTTLEKRLLWLQ